jgi:DNA-binding NarL/FixJ family response regulator
VSARTIRVLVADDHAGFRAGLAALLRAQDDVALVGEAVDGTDAVAKALELQPDGVLMDLAMPGHDCVAATRRIADTSPHIAVLVLTMADDDAAVFDALRAGARGYLLKGADRTELTRAIHAVAAGGAIFGPDVARRLLQSFASAPASRALAFPELSEREREILELVARGLSNQQIVDRLVISPKTVRNHVSNIFGKLQVRDRAEAVVRAREAGLGGVPRGSGHGPHDGGTDPA